MNESLNDAKTKELINERERRLLIGSAKLLEEINQNNKRNPKNSSGETSKNNNNSKKTLDNKKNTNSKEKIKIIGKRQPYPNFSGPFIANDIRYSGNLNEPDSITNKKPISTSLYKQDDNSSIDAKRQSLEDLSKKNFNGRKSSPALLGNNSKKKNNVKPIKDNPVSQALAEFPKPQNKKESLRLFDKNKRNTPFFIESKESQEQPSKILPSTNRKNFLINRRADITAQINSLIKIQSFSRMIKPRLQYIKMKNASKRIQKTFRGYLIRKLFQAIRDAVIFIQYMYRKYKARSKLENLQ